MTIILLFALALSFLCAVTLVSACILSGRTSGESQETYVEQQAVKAPTTRLSTTSSPLA